MKQLTNLMLADDNFSCRRSRGNFARRLKQYPIQLFLLANLSITIKSNQLVEKSTGRLSFLRNKYKQREYGTLHRSSCPEVFCKKGVPRNFAKFTGKHLCQILFLISCRPEACNFIKKETLARVNFAKFLRTPFFIEHFWWLLLTAVKKKGRTKNTQVLLKIGVPNSKNPRK